MMIINTGMRTDIPAFYADWFVNRLKAGFVLVRNPYNPRSVTRYRLSPDVVDLIGFCTKNPAPLFPYRDLLASFGQFWYVTITPYGHSMESLLTHHFDSIRVSVEGSDIKIANPNLDVTLLGFTKGVNLEMDTVIAFGS